MGRQTAADVRAYNRARYERMKAERLALAHSRLGGRCTACGSTDRLEFDHVDPTTFYHSPRGLILASPDVFLAEVDKCQLLCHDCHKAKTRRANGWFKVGSIEGRPHGMKTTYNEGCRCQECRAAIALAQASRSGGRTKYTF